MRKFFSIASLRTPLPASLMVILNTSFEEVGAVVYVLLGTSVCAVTTEMKRKGADYGKMTIKKHSK